MQKFPIPTRLFPVAAGLLLAAGVVLACDLNVREAGFLNNRGGPYFPQQYGLRLVTAKDSPEVTALRERLTAIATNELQESNLTIGVYTADMIKEDDRAQMRADGIDLSKLPVTFLFRQEEARNTVVATFPRLLGEEEIRALALSPGRLRLQKLLSDNGNYAVILLLPGTDQTANAAARKEIAAGLKECEERLAAQKMPLLVVDKADKAEKSFLDELGVVPGAEPLCAVVFGKGRIVAPILRGAEITGDAFSRMFGFLRANASDCTPEAVYVPGSTVDMIMPWSQRLDVKMYEAIAKSGVIPDLVWNEAPVDPSTGQIVENAAAGTAASQEPSATAQKPRPKSSKSRPAWVYSTAAAGIFGGVCLVVAGVVLLRRRSS